MGQETEEILQVRVPGWQSHRGPWSCGVSWNHLCTVLIVWWGSKGALGTHRCLEELLGKSKELRCLGREAAGAEGQRERMQWARAVAVIGMRMRAGV